jgi:hypothetical protein
LYKSYNSAIFDVVVGNQFNVTTVEYASTEYFRLNSSAANLSNSAMTYRNLSNAQWQSLYSASYVSGVGDLFLIVDQVSLDIQTYQAVFNNASAFSSQFEGYEPTQSSPQLSLALPGVSANGWIPDGTNETTGTRPIHIRNAYAQNVPDGNSKLEISLWFMLIVIASNLVKAVVMFLVLMEDSCCLVTVGDAIASFLEKPDLITTGCCTLSKEDMLIKFGYETHISFPENKKGKKKLQKLNARLDGIWKPRKRRPGNAISGGRQLFGTIM